MSVKAEETVILAEGIASIAANHTRIDCTTPARVGCEWSFIVFFPTKQYPVHHAVIKPSHWAVKPSLR